MATAAYSKASRHSTLWVLIILAGVLVMIVLFATLDGKGWADRLGGWMLLVGAVPIALSVGMALLITNRLNRARISGLVRPLELSGFAATAAPTPDEKAHLGRQLPGLIEALSFGAGSAGIQWFATEAGKAPSAFLFEHEYVTGSGRTTQVHNHTVLAWPADHPEVRMHDLGAKPAFGLGRFSWTLRRVYKERQLKGVPFDELGERWLAFGDAETGRKFLTEGVRAVLARSPAGEQWYVGRGWIGCAFRGTLAGEHADAFVKHARSVVGAAK